MTEGLVDPTLGMDSQARAVMAYLEGMEPDFANWRGDIRSYDVSLETRPWYNGRERGFVISMQHGWLGKGAVIHIAVFEHRNSDSICALVWDTPRFYYNGPISDDETLNLAYGGGDKYNVTKEFKAGAIGEVADWIYATLETFYAMSKAGVEGVTA